MFLPAAWTILSVQMWSSISLGISEVLGCEVYGGRTTLRASWSGSFLARVWGAVIIRIIRYTTMELFAAGKQNDRAKHSFYCLAPSRDVSLNLSAEAPLHVIISLSDGYRPLVLRWYGSEIQALKTISISTVLAVATSNSIHRQIQSRGRVYLSSN